MKKQTQKLISSMMVVIGLISIIVFNIILLTSPFMGFLKLIYTINLISSIIVFAGSVWRITLR